jgi:hypothetical protein
MASSRNAIRKKIKQLGPLLILFEEKIVQRVVQCHIFAQSPTGRYPSGKDPANSSHSPLLVENVSYVVSFDSLATVIHIQSIRSQICIYM